MTTSHARPRPARWVPDDAPQDADLVARLRDVTPAGVSRAQLTRIIDGCRRDLAGSPIGAMPELVERLTRQRLQSGLVAHAS